MELPAQLNQEHIAMPKNITMNIVPTRNASNLGITAKTEEVTIFGETRTTVTGKKANGHSKHFIAQ